MSFANKVFLLTILIVSTLAIQKMPRVRFTNFKCKTFDASFLHFEGCFIKSVNRSYQYLSTKAVMHQLPITTFSVNVATMMKANEYRPFMYNVTIDCCKFLGQRNNPLYNFMYGFLKPYTNVNHQCPINHDFTLEKLSNAGIDYFVTDKLPIPRGEYAVLTKWYLKKVLKASVDVYVTLS